MDIADAKAVLPFPALLNRLGVPTPGKDKFNIPCLLHNEQNGKSFSVERKNGTWLWHCFGKCARGGDEITFLEVYKSVPRGAAIELYLEMAGNGATKAWPRLAAATAQFDWQKCVDDCGEENTDGIAKWRGFSPGFVKELRDKGQIGIYRGRVAFPVHDDGKIVGIHVRLKNGDWYYEPKGLKAAPLVFGELVSDERVQIFESTWDGPDYMDKSGERDGIIITRGASNGARVCNLIPSSSTLFLWPQNDEPGEKWARDICTHTNAIVKRVKTPTHHKDLNDWTRAGATTDDLLAAVLNAETLQEAAPMWLPGELFNEIKAHITRYVVFSRPEHADAVTLWVMHTWVVDSFHFTPYIYLHSPVMRCGKTQVHRVVEPLVKNPLRTCSISESALFREIADSHPTLLWDEIDSIFGNRKSSEANENKRALLNAGYERDIRAIRMERSAGGFKKISYDPFCPKILAGIGRLPDTIVDRSIPILIHRRLKTQPCQKYRRQDRISAKPLYDALERWASEPDLLKTLRESQPQMPESLTDRQEDIWEPLVAIADSIGGDVPELARKAARALCNNSDDDLGYGAKQLLAIKKVVGDRDRITSADLINGLWEADALPSKLMEVDEPNHKKIGHWLSKFIKSYGGQPARQLRFGDKTLKGYESAELKPVLDRYCPLEEENL